jgi:hypothetical protein
MAGPAATTVRFTLANPIQLRAGGLVIGPDALLMR